MSEIANRSGESNPSASDDIRSLSYMSTKTFVG